MGIGWASRARRTKLIHEERDPLCGDRFQPRGATPRTKKPHARSTDMELEPKRHAPCVRFSWRGWGVGLANLHRPPELPFKTLYISPCMLGDAFHSMHARRCKGTCYMQTFFFEAAHDDYKYSRRRMIRSNFMNERQAACNKKNLLATSQQAASNA